MQRSEKRGWFLRFGAFSRITTALAIAVASFVAQPAAMAFQARWMASWNAGTLTYLVLAWALILKADAKETREHTLSQDPGTYVIFLLVVGAACASLVAIGVAVGPLKGYASWTKTLNLALVVIALISSWLLIHTVFTFHYARCYYEPQRPANGDARGMAFPNDRTPDYLDFAYYSFVVGMTSQVSDVQTTTRRVRRLTLIHGMLSFVFNIAVLAMSMNIIANAI